ncbi:hypothetical protein GCM10009715_06720 [Paeniglutamicibacter psychrophenolicus]|uniref:S-DNA-T family DNA segregation ATPase FtsK/SpoIIIE n=1 Tax=Paeniglutamicibacter psychrophenolicus TaxID=257454 RepID=A0ABS4WH17_9MICC|nr:FtsK/SpoIIIE domain-containing protein [Paeniglutamicibacter psychrophenolicus]MBP2375423.1 S-DNA-T family DNA segregation ATPase FtsK/SpoIIIE [Paeniglutamicibacter psychrophenolicus]
MGRKLFIRLVSATLGRPVLVELEAAEPLGGPVLASALARRWPQLRWHAGGRPLEQIARLPRQGRMLLCDVPAAPADLAPRRWQGADGGIEPAVLVVLRGPDPGGTLPLRRGLWALGRGGVDLPIGDLRLSRRHALVRVTETSIVLSDEGSANGVWFAQTPIRERRLLIGDTFSAGDSSFGVLPPGGLPAVPARWPLPPVPIDAEEPGSRMAMMLVGALAPLGLGVGLFLMTHSVFFLAFSAISLVTGGLPALLVLRGKAGFRRAWALSTTADAKRREDLAPPVGAVAAGLAAGASVDDDGFPAMVIGHGPLAAWLCTASGADPPVPRPGRGHREGGRGSRGRARRAQRHGPGNGNGAAGDADSETVVEPGVLSDSPVPLALKEGSAVWFQGPESVWGPVLRAVLVRWLPLLASGSLRVVVQGPAGFLPSEFAMLPGVQVSGANAPLAPDPRPTIVLLTGPGTLRAAVGESPGAAFPGAPARIHCGGPAPSPGAEVHIDCSTGRILLRAAGSELNPWLRPAPPAGIRKFRRSPGGRARPGRGRQSPETGASPHGTREPSLHVFTEGIGLPVLARAVSRMLPWVEAGPEAGGESGTGTPFGAVVGDTDAGPLRVDLDADGPHLLVAGTTGSGKSELLRTLVLGLSAESGPDALAFMLVDFKGGATLAPLRGLPHVQLFVSDLDAAEGERILELLGNELHRRETFLAAHAATDHRDYLRSRVPGDPPLPRLVVLIDEFRVFATELPQALERVIHIATVGRSLGIHLVLSTQRPAGTVSAPLRANIGSVIALRTIGEAESNDLIGSSVAARLDPSAPGLAYFRRGGGAPLGFRARVNARPSIPARLRAFGADLGATLFSEQLPHVGSGQGPAATGVPDSDASQGSDAELAAVVRGIVFRHRDIEPAPNPFSASLPQTLPAIGRAVLRQVPGGAGAIGLVDRPKLPQAGPLVFDPRTTARLMVCGLPASGIEKVPGLLLHAVNRQSWRMPTLLLDGNGTHGALRGHPAVGGYFGPGDSWRINELLLQLGDPGCVEPMLLLVSGLGGWARALEGSVFMGLEAQLAAFARTAPDLGRALVLCGDRDLAGSRAASLCETRWYFPRGAGPEVLMGWPQLRKVAPQVGRGVLLGPDEPEHGTAFQVLDDAASLPLPGGEVPGTWLCSVPLPESLVSAQLQALDPGSAAAPELAIGLCGPDNRTFVWAPGPCGLVIGHEGSGKSTLLRHLSLLGDADAGHTVRLGLGDELPVQAEEFMQRHPKAARVLVDRADLRVARAARAAEVLLGAGLQLVLSAEPGSRLLFELGLSAVVRDARSFLVLDPQFGADADPSGFRLPPATVSVRGRAMVADRGTIRQVQCVNRVP